MKGTFRVSVFQFRPYHGTQLYNEILKIEVLLMSVNLINQ